MKKSVMLAVISSTVFLFACTNKYVDSQHAERHSDQVKAVKTAGVDNFESWHESNDQRADKVDNKRHWTHEKDVMVKGDEIVLFDFDKSALDPATKDLLKQYADYLAQHPNYKVRIEGHTDERGSREYNIALGERRAKELARMLMLDGVAQKRISMLSYGKEKPKVSGHDEASWAQNRRGVITLIKDNDAE